MTLDVDTAWHRATRVVPYVVMWAGGSPECGGSNGCRHLDAGTRRAIDSAVRGRAPDGRDWRRALIEQYCASFRQMPKRIVLDVDDTFDRVHGGQQLRLFNAFHDDYGFQPIVVFDGEGRFVTALLRPGKRPGGYEIRAFLRRLVGAIRAFWPRVEILLRADSHYACPEVFDWCRENRVDWVLGLAPNAALRRHVEALEKTTAERFTVAPARGKVRRFAQFHDAAGSWSRVERIIARVEAGADGTDTRFIVTNLEGGRAKPLYERLYCARGQAEKHIKAWTNHLAADRTSFH